MKAAAGTAVATLLVGAALWGTSTTAQAKATGVDDQTFTIGLTNEVDSFNPFNGIEAESYEAWALMYDYMISWSDKDMSPQPGLATSWDTSPDGLTWTFHIRDGVKWSDGQPLTANDIAYTYNRILDGGPEAASWASYLGSVDKITAPDADPPRAHLEERQRGRRQDLRQRARERGPAGRRLGPVRAGRGQGRRLDVPLRAQRRLLGRQAEDG
jgi:peptide/nickel transport system substrate-binding protein